jgi:spore germination cell wall hydrolase CwlJ-like protein
MIKVVLALILFLGMSYTPEITIELPTAKEFDCLVKNVYYEARGESLMGKVAVAKVTMNRVKHPNYPKTICAVVYQHKQFSWTSKPRKAKVNTEEWLASVDAAVKGYNLEGFEATHYHNMTVRPKWGLHKVGVIGNHIFYM